MTRAYSAVFIPLEGDAFGASLSFLSGEIDMETDVLNAPKGAFALIAFGSNLGDPVKNVKKGLAALRALPGVRVVKRSSFYKTFPVGTSRDKPSYVNGVVELETRLSPSELLTELQGIEERLGRVRTDFWGDRTIDLDILLYEDVVMETEELTLPHRRIQWRDFVLSPACEIVPEVKVPILDRTFRQLKTLLDWNFRDYRVIVEIICRTAVKENASELFRRGASEAPISER